MYSQISKYEFRTISLEEGLSQSTVFSIFQDSKGFIWFGTNDGISRYDGRNLSLLSFQDGKEQKTIKGSIRGLDEGAGGNLYIANYGVGLNVYNINNDNVINYYHSDSIENSLMCKYLNSVLCIDEKTVWIASDRGVSRLNPLTGTFRNYILPEKKTHGVSGNGAFSLFYDENRGLWIGTQGRGLLKYIPEEERFIPFVNKTQGGDIVKKNFIKSIVEFKDGLFLVATKNGLFLFDPQTGGFFKYLINEIELFQIAKDQFGGYWITSRFNGLYHIDKNEKLERFNNNPYDLLSFPDSQLLGAYKDNIQNIWIGTRTKGVVQINLERKPFVNLYHVPNKPSIADNSVFALAEDENGDVWIGTTKGLAIWNRKKNSFKPVGLRLYNKRLVYDVSVWSLYFDNNDVVWIGTNLGLIKYNRKNGRQTHYYNDPNKPSSLIYNDVVSIEKDKNDNLWMSTLNGISRLNKKTNSFVNYYVGDSTENSISHNKVWDILCDSKGRLWFCTEDGLDLYNYETDDFSVIRFSSSSFNSGNMLSNSTISVTESEKGEIWVTTESGVFIYDPENKNIKGYVKAGDEISEELAYYILETDDSFWASTNNGIVVVDKDNYTIKTRYSADDGLLSNEFNSGAVVKLSDGYFLFGGIKGVAMFNPDHIHKSDYCPPVYLTDISLFGKEVSPENPLVWERANFNKNIISASRITFTPDEKMVTLKFSALDYIYPKRVSYFYRILPVSEEWISIGKRNFITFINLNPGEYILEIKSTNGDGIMCDNVRSLELVISPPFWRKWWIISSGIFILVLLVLLIFRLRILRLRKDKKKLENIVNVRTREIQTQRNIANKQRDEIVRQKEKLQDFAAGLEYKVRERTKELEYAKLKAEESDRLKSAFLSNMSHEIRTPMNAILGFSELLLTTGFDEQERENFARMVKSNGDALLSLLNDIIDISMIESGQLKLNFADVHVCELINDIFLTFNNSKLLGEKKAVSLLLSVNVNSSIIINTDINRLRQVITNLLSNSLKFTDKGSVQLGCEEEEYKIIFFVKDTGIGISDEYKDKIFERFYKLGKDEINIYGGNGLGLAITKSLVEALKGEIWFDTEEGEGTTFYFTIPKQ